MSNELYRLRLNSLILRYKRSVIRAQTTALANHRALDAITGIERPLPIRLTHLRQLESSNG